jgi:small subunit ribosomal protein S4
MGRNLDPVCKLCRREGVKLYLKGARCESNKCAIERRNAAPGMHGYRRSKLSEYGVRLREKQRLKRFYGVFERQFRRYFSIASRSKENTGEALLSVMERRLDNVVHRLGFAPNRASARQLVSHGHIYVNNKVCTIPSILLKPGDTVTVARSGNKEKEARAVLADAPGRERSVKLVKAYLTETLQPVPDFLERIDGEIPEGRLTRLPSRGDVDPRIQDLREQLIIEFCSR